MPQYLSPENFPRRLAPGMRVYLPGGPSEPAALLDALALAPEAARGVTFFGAFAPGINRRDPSALHSAARLETYFIGPDFRAGFAGGRVHYLPMPYRAIYEHMRGGPRASLAVLHVAPPDAEGRLSLGLNADFGLAIAQNTDELIGLVNREMPAPKDGLSLPPDRFSALITGDAPLLEEPAAKVSPVIERIAGHAVSLVPDGATLEFGIGQMQAAALAALKSHRRLRIHSGMISDPVLGLIGAGALADEAGAITTGFALGTRRLYEAAAREPRFRFRGVDVTHEFEVLRRIPDFIAINSVLEVDLFGQANAEMLGTEQISGVGGLQDFLRGARFAPRGKAIVTLAATAKGGSLSRIVPRLSAPATISRHDLDYVVTEEGVARLGGASIDERADRLIAIAAPAYRAALAAAWAEMRRVM